MKSNIEDDALTVEEHFIIDSEGVVFRGARIGFDQIGSIYYFALQRTTLFISGSQVSELKCFDWSGRCIVRSATSIVYASKRRNKARFDAYRLISEKTFQQRLNAALQSLSEKGYYDYHGVRFLSDGKLSDRRYTLDLRKAKANGTLGRGVDVNAHAYRQSDPFLYWVSETAGTRRTGILSFLNSDPVITFAAKYDSDVIQAIVRILSSDN